MTKIKPTVGELGYYVDTIVKVDLHEFKYALANLLHMEIFVKYIVPILAMLVLSPALNAADIAAGKARAAICAACHGTAGISPNDLWPNLAGQKKTYLVRQIKAFRDGDRVDPMMAPMVRSLTDTDVENIAAYYSSLK